MAAFAGIFGHNDQEYYPSEHKIVDLPIIQMPVMQVLRNYPCKIYRQTENGEWKRRCYGRIKFVQNQGMIVVAAFQHGSCLNRLSVTPTEHSVLFTLSPSQEFEYSWITKIPTKESEQTLSIALNDSDYQQFQTEWQNTKTVNTQFQQNNWMTLINSSLFS